MKITSIEGYGQGSLIRLEIDNESASTFSLNFAPTDIVVYDDQNQAYKAVQVANGNLSVNPHSQLTTTSIEIQGHPAGTAKTWTVAFKALAGRPNVKLMYNF